VNSFVVVIPACQKDIHLAMLMLEWMAELGQTPTHRVVFSLSRFIRDEQIQALEAAASKVFIHWKTWTFPDDLARFPWPIPHNNHFQKTVRSMKVALDGQPEQSWFWVEPDCVPLHKDWLLRFEEEHAKSTKQGKHFTGSLVSMPHPTSTPDHMTGNAIYPRDLPRYAPSVMFVSKTAWDVGGAEEIIPQAYFTDILQHVYESPRFETMNSVNRTVRNGAVLFHQSKDGAMIQRLREIRKAEAQVVEKAVIPTLSQVKPLIERLGPQVAAKGKNHVRSPKLVRSKAAEIYHAYHFGLNGQPPQTLGYLAQIYGVSVSTISRAVHHPEKFGYKPPAKKESVPAA
jgi:hypothetical protein